MDIRRQRIHTNMNKVNKKVQMTMDHDINVADTKPDVEKIIHSCGHIEIRETESMVGKVKVKGIFCFQLLYMTPENGHSVAGMEGMVDFEEYVYDDSILPGDLAKVKAIIEDMNISIINSRKLSIRGLFCLQADISEEDVVEGAANVEETEEAQCQFKNMNLTTLAVNKKDSYRKKQEFMLPSGKPEVQEILWSSITLSDMEIRVFDDTFELKATLGLFIIYRPEEENVPIQYFEAQSPIQDKITCENAQEGMIPDISFQPSGKQVHIKPDEEGILRVLEADAGFDMDIKLYEDCHYEMLSDVYAPRAEIEMKKEAFSWSRLLLKNNAKTKVMNRVKINPEHGKCMQICHVDGDVKIDEVTCYEDGIRVEGIVSSGVLYFSDDDTYPVCAAEDIQPFSFLIESDGVKPEDRYEVNALVEEIGATPFDENTLEIKAVVRLELIAFSNETGSIITEIEEKPLDVQKMQNLPGMVGYIVKPEDTLWAIAKRYYTTMDKIMEVNGLEKKEVQPGDKLIIIT